MKAQGRYLRIRELLESQEFVDLETLCRELNTSESSVRRDLIALEAEGHAKRVYGGATLLHPQNHGMDFDWQSTRFAEEKRRIGLKAASLIEDGQTVLLDGGSTVASVAQALRGRALNIITNSLPIASALNDERRMEVTLIGGYLYPRLRITLGPFAEQMLAGVAADVLVMGIGGVTADGFSNSNTLVVGSELKMIEVARKVIIVTDHTKFGRNAVIHLADLNMADAVVSDAGLTLEYQELLREQMVEVLIA